jgi:copper(I)-binding protein
MNAFRVARGLLAVAFLAGAATAHEATSKGVTVAHPWVRANPEGSTISAAFMEIRTDKDVSDKLISATSPVAGRVEVHTHIMDGDVMKMRRVDALDLKPGDSRVLKPMGDHMMLFDLKQPLKEGDLVKLQLTFEKAGTIEVEGTVEPVAANGPHGMDHQPTAADDMGGMPMDHGSGDEKTGHDHEGHEHMDHQ